MFFFTFLFFTEVRVLFDLLSKDLLFLTYIYQNSNFFTVHDEQCQFPTCEATGPIKCEISLIQLLAVFFKFYFDKYMNQDRSCSTWEFIVTSYKFYLEEEYMTKNVSLTLRQITTNNHTHLNIFFIHPTFNKYIKVDKNFEN